MTRDMLWSRLRAFKHLGPNGAHIRVAALAAALGACAAAGMSPDPAISAEAVKYEVSVEGVADDAIQVALERTLRSYRFKDDGAASLALLRRRAESDVETVEKVLRAEGYYEASAEATVTPGADGEAKVVIAIAPGRPFTLVEHALDIVAPPGSAAAEQLGAEGSPIGERAAAAPILAAEAGAVARLRSAGRPYAEFASRSVEADFERAELRVRSRIQAGPRAVFGPLRIRGAEGVDPGYLESYRTWSEGELFDEEAMAAYQRAVAGTGLFELALVSKPKRPPAGRREPVVLPVTLEATTAPPRSIGLGARYSTDSGPEARISFEHRNLAGAGEKLSIVLEGGAEDQSLRSELRKPQFARPGQDLVASASLRRDQGDAFNEAAATLTLGLDRDIGQWLGGAARIGVGALAEVSEIEDAATVGGSSMDETAYLLGAPTFLTIDARDDPLNPTKGFRLRGSATPFTGSVDGEGTAFLVVDAEGSTYLALDEDARWVLASRARLAAIFSEDLAGVPAPRRLYSGGGGSVRGYADRFVGPLDAGGDPIGGRSAVELGAELRWRASEMFGAVLFAEAGAVSPDLGSIFEEDVQIGVGPGLRYYSPVGPIGVDVGVPVDPRPDDAPYQLYFFIGQAF